ncbi:MAG: Demethylrebeccamycin-D-glucose O-methyltransferase [Bacteroidetes bacterium ADurb.Bin139]|mgnify:FL=1|nr:MAG: Demethylrebeccamycin-D-glucose O-methyltransferase [Bacteroidetes bacterium ADurb.Bin139]
MMLLVYAKKYKTMNNEKSTIHEFDLSIIYDFFSNTKRQGPGSPEETLKALSFIDGLTDKSKIADIGCGTGGQTMVLGQNTSCQIIGIDSWSGFINQFNLDARHNNLQDRVKGIVGDMNNLPFQEGELDLIWSEGAIYNIGFERGLNEWRKFLKQGGYIAVTENTWFSDERPAQIQEFWDEAYPQIDTIPNKVAQMHKAGYLPVATYILPQTIWTDYYAWQALRLEHFLIKHSGNKMAEEFAALERYEAALYYKYKAYYGYMFYIGKKM